MQEIEENFYFVLREDNGRADIFLEYVPGLSRTRGNESADESDSKFVFHKSQCVKRCRDVTT